MRILCVCNEGNNRSVQFSHLLKYKGNDTIPVGIDTASTETLEMLFNWCDKILVTESSLIKKVPDVWGPKIILCDVGKDIYPRPFNKDLMNKAKALVAKYF